MNTQYELRAYISDEFAEVLDVYFLENQLAEWGIMQKEINDPYEVFGIFANAEEAQSALARLREDFPDLPELFTENIIQDADWKNAYKVFVKPWHDRRLHWVPLWERAEYTVPADAVVVYLDAGMAFGTGAHETTRLCARRLLDYYSKHKDELDALGVIDAGCGSGILAFSAAALGFSKVFGFDYDPEAITVCWNNAAENAHIPRPDFAVADIAKDLENRQTDLLLANIQSDILVPCCHELVQAVSNTGTLVLSGILTKEVEEVRTCYAAEFSKLNPESKLLIDSRQEGEWSDLLFTITE